MNDRCTANESLATNLEIEPVLGEAPPPPPNGSDVNYCDPRSVLTLQELAAQEADLSQLARSRRTPPDIGVN